MGGRRRYSILNHKKKTRAGKIRSGGVLIYNDLLFRSYLTFRKSKISSPTASQRAAFPQMTIKTIFLSLFTVEKALPLQPKHAFLA